MSSQPQDAGAPVALVTGASGGIGEAAAAALAARGMTVVMAVRDAARGEAARARILSRHAQAALRVSLLDLADLASIRTFAARESAALPRLDLLLNNAGLGLQQRRGETADGFERQLGTNHLGHFALTGLLVPTLLRAAAPRVVTISSIAHRRGRIDFDDLQRQRRYDPSSSYAQSKLANLMFALELDRRARAQGSRLVSVAAHPGISSTGFFAATGIPPFLVPPVQTAIRLIGHDAVAGAAPGVHAALAPDVVGGQYWGPDGFKEIKGRPAPAAIASQALDITVWSRLWTVSEQLTGVVYPPLA